jgi:SAM-dependent methyltransferase
VPVSLYEQRDQPEGVPPLALTGERTLPDVPEENYWFRRHLAVYEWIATRVAGMRVVDMACGEGYGSDVLAHTAARVVGVDANPEAHEHARLRYRRANLRFERDLVESFSEEADAVVFLQTIEHLQDPGAVLERFRSLVSTRGKSTSDTRTLDSSVSGASALDASASGASASDASAPGISASGASASDTRASGTGERGMVFVSTPNVLTLAPKGAPRSDNPWHVHEYRADEFAKLCRTRFASVEMHGLFHARKLRVHELALRLGWDAIHPRLGLTKRFYDRFTPAIAASDFVLRPAGQANLDRALDFVAVCRL